MPEDTVRPSRDRALDLRSPIAAPVVALGIIYALVVLFLFGGGLVLARAQTLSAAHTRAAAIASFSAVYSSRMYDLGAVVASDVAGALSGKALSAEGSVPLISAAAERTAQNDYIIVVNADGAVIASSDSFRPLRARSDALNAHRSGAKRFIGTVIRSRLTHDVIYRVSERIEAPGGGFGGFASVAIRPFGVQSTARRRPGDPQVSVWSQDGRFVAATFVDFDADGSAVVPPRPRDLGGVLPGQVTDRDGVIHAESRVEGLPLIVSVDLDKNGVLGSWRRTAAITAAVALLLLLPGVALVFLGLRATARERASHRALLRAQSETEASLRAREMLLREIHHRVRNSLMLVSSFLTLQARGANAETRDALARVQTRVISIGVVHETLYAGSDLGLIDLKDYLGRLLPELATGLGIEERSIGLTLVEADLTVASEQATTLGLIVSEAVTNAVKYAFETGGWIRVSARRLDGHHAELVVQDNGRGLMGAGEGGLGSHLLEALARQLGGRSTIQGETGTTIRVVFPVGPAETVSAGARPGQPAGSNPL